MPRVKRAVMHVKRRHNLRKKVKGFRSARKNTIRLSKTAATKAGAYAYVGRKLKKRDYRGLWAIRIGAAAKLNGWSYSQLMGALKKNKIELDRKVLAELAANHPKIFTAIVNEVKK